MTTTLTIQETGTTLTVASTLRMTASEAETLLDGVFEPVLGNPGTNGYVLSSTTAGVRSWVEQSGGGGGGGDVDDLTTTTGSSSNMLRVAAAGGLEYRTTAQVLADIGAAPTASPTFTGTVTLPTTVASVIKPAADSTTALQLTNAAGTAVVTVNTTNKLVNINASRTDAALCINPSGLRDGIYITGQMAGTYQNGFEVDVTGTNGTEVRGFTLTARVLSTNAVDTVYGGYISSPVLTGTATNVYGLRIGNQSGGSSANYAIYTGTGLIRFGDIINFAGTMGNSTKVVGTDAPADWVQVQIGGITYYLPAYAA